MVQRAQDGFPVDTCLRWSDRVSRRVSGEGADAFFKAAFKAHPRSARDDQSVRV